MCIDMWQYGAYMYVSIYVCVCVYIHVYKYIYIHLHKYTYIYMYIYIYGNICVSICLYTQMHIYKHTETHSYQCRCSKNLEVAVNLLDLTLQVIIRYIMWGLEPTTKPSLHSQLSLNFKKINLICNRFHYGIFIILCFGLSSFILLPPSLLCLKKFPLKFMSHAFNYCLLSYSSIFL